MKKIIVFILIVRAFMVNAQDYEPEQMPFYFQNDSTYYLSADSAYFKQDKFILGWAWSSGRKMSEALLCTQAHVGHNYSTDGYLR